MSDWGYFGRQTAAHRELVARGRMLFSGRLAARNSLMAVGLAALPPPVVRFVTELAAEMFARGYEACEQDRRDIDEARD